ncbi:hypothetical protein GIB67_015738, partial [Kingdonia uniflora]
QSEEEKSVLYSTCFAPLLLIDPIATMSMLVMEIFDRHLGDMKFQFWETIIQMKPIHVCLILGLRVSPIANEILFVDPEHMTNFRMRQFPKKKNTYGLKEIVDALKQAKLEKRQEDVLRLNLLKIILSFLLLNKRRNIEVRYQIEAPTIGAALAIGAPAIGIPAVGAPAAIVPAISSSSSTTEIGDVLVRQAAPGEILEVPNALMVDYDVEFGREVNFNALSPEYGGDLLETKECKEEVFEGKDDDDGNSPNKPDPEQLVLMESEVDITLKKRHALTEEEINKSDFKMACKMSRLHAHLDELLPGVLLESFIQRPISQDEKN